MKDDFANAFADFLEDRFGKALFSLRDKNEEYCRLSDKYAALLKNEYQSVEEYRQAFLEISDVSLKLADVEKRYLFLSGMREQARIKDAVLLDDFEKIFIG